MLPFFLLSYLKIHSISVEGNHFFPTSRIVEALRLKEGGPFSRVRLRSGIARLQILYASKGFFSARIESSYRINPDATVDIVIRIDEGKRAWIIDLVFEGDTILPYVARLERNFKPVPYDEDFISSLETDIYYFYYENGYPHFQMTRDTSFLNDTAIVLRERISSGPPVTIRRIVIEGNRHIRPAIFFKEIVVRPPEIFRYSKVMESVRRLYSLQVFDAVNYRVRDDSILVFVVKESKLRYLENNVGFTYPSYLYLSFRLGHYNIFGNMQNLEVAPVILLSFSDGVSIYERRLDVFYRERYFLDRKNLRFNMNAFHYRTKDINEYGLNAETIKEFSRYFYVHLGLSWKKTETFTYQPYININSIFQRATYDDRNNILDATFGVLMSLYTQRAFTGANFWKFTEVYAIYRSLDIHTLALRLRGGQIFSREEVPYSERFLLGGEGSVRGYDFNSIGTVVSDSLNPASTNYFNFNLEYRNHLTSKFGFVLFLDGAWTSDTLSLLFSGRPALGYGFGLRFYVGFAPIRIDFAISDKFKVFPADVRIYFGVGNMF